LTEGESFQAKYKKIILQIDVGLVSLLSLTECFCYFFYFHYIYHHDNYVAAGVISMSTLKNRNRTNAISMVGQAISLLAQFWYILIVGILYAIFKGSLREVKDIFLRNIIVIFGKLK
jgi:hypothetical protein